MVTSVNDSEAQNFGVDAHLGHDERYDRADEFMDVVAGRWRERGAEPVLVRPDHRAGLRVALPHPRPRGQRDDAPVSRREIGQDDSLADGSLLVL